MQVGTVRPPARFSGRNAQQEIGYDEIQTLRRYWRDNPTDDGFGCAGCSAIGERRAQGYERAGRRNGLTVADSGGRPAQALAQRIAAGRARLPLPYRRQMRPALVRIG